ncbi:hypothetical protein NL676_010852, partial [Syzygium grande]
MKYPKTQLKSGKIFEKPRTNIHGSSLKLEANAVAPVKRLQQKRPKREENPRGYFACQSTGRVVSTFIAFYKIASKKVKQVSPVNLLFLLSLNLEGDVAFLVLHFALPPFSDFPPSFNRPCQDSQGGLRGP